MKPEAEVFGLGFNERLVKQAILEDDEREMILGDDGEAEDEWIRLLHEDHHNLNRRNL